MNAVGEHAGSMKPVEEYTDKIEAAEECLDKIELTEKCTDKVKIIEEFTGKIGNYSVAPYNFVSLPHRAFARYKSIEELPAHDSYKDKEGRTLLNGYIEYTLKAMTPIIVSKGANDEDSKDKESKGGKTVEFFVNNKGVAAIPGNTIRGAVRTNAQILSFSSVVRNKSYKGKYLNSEIQDSRFMYREVASSTSLGRKYKKELGISTNLRLAKYVKAGYIYKMGENKYEIRPAKQLIKDLYYFRIDEIELRKMLINKSIPGMDFMYKPKIVEFEPKIKELNRKYALENNDEKKKAIANEKNKLLEKLENKDSDGHLLYEPYYVKISFEYDKKSRKISKIGNENEYTFKGYIISSGFIGGKRSHYIIPEVDKDEEFIKIPEDRIIDYENDLIRTKKMNKQNEITDKKNEIFGLPQKEGAAGAKPVFFIKKDGVIHFGFTPFLRLYYNKTVLDGVPEFYKKEEGINYADAIFGFAHKDENGKEIIAYKSRVYFEDAEIQCEPVVDEDSSISVILGEPKPTSYNLYLKQKKGCNKKELEFYDVNEDNKMFEIRGIKQYWLKDYIAKPESEGKGDGEDNKDKEKGKEKNKEKLLIKLLPLKKGSVFKGKIHFRNLYEDELGLLLWALKLNEGCFLNIGLAKPYGFGRIKVENVKLYIEDIERKYSYFCFDYYDPEDPDKFIALYKEKFSKEYLNDNNIEEQKPIRELMYIKSKVVKENERNNYRYMRLNIKKNERNEFNDRKPLPEILDFMDLKPESSMDSKDNLASKSNNYGNRNYSDKNNNGNSENKNYSKNYDNKNTNNKYNEKKYNNENRNDKYGKPANYDKQRLNNADNATGNIRKQEDKSRDNTDAKNSGYSNNSNSGKSYNNNRKSNYAKRNSVSDSKKVGNIKDRRLVYNPWPEAFRNVKFKFDKDTES